MNPFGKLFNELTIGVVFAALLVLFLDPFMYFMSDSVEYMIIAGFVIAAALFLVFVWRERAHDEREELHLYLASRWAYLIGAAVLSVAVVVEKYSYGSVDPWLVVALGFMVFAKLAGLFYGRLKH